MYVRAYCAGCVAGAVIIAFGTTALAHGFAGPRFFPATIATDDPFVADELALPTVGWFKDSDDTRTTTYSVDFAKRITPNFGLEVGATYLHLSPPGGPSVEGFDNVSVGAKYQLGVNPMRETIFSIGVDADLGGTGAKHIGAESFSTIAPTFFFGKGFGDWFERDSMMRAFAVTGSIGVAIPTKARTADGEGGFEEHPDALEFGFALEYSLPYLQSQVRNVGLGAPFDRMVFITELSFETPIDRGGGTTTGTVNPGLLWAGQYVQFAVEAVIPWNRDSGHAVGFLAQFHVYLDDVFPMTLGRPIFRR